jgi:hypothetical protein
VRAPITSRGEGREAAVPMAHGASRVLRIMV